MQKRRLGRTDLWVTEICLGTMTWGRQNTEAEGHAQMDYALDRGVTFWDTAEMYAIPPTAETYGRTEAIIGSWLAARGGRDRIVLATKVIGHTPGGFAWVRDGKARLDRANITKALEDSLRRLNTDYVDLYQLHWPDRPSPRFGALGWTPGDDGKATPIAETVAVLDDLVKQGKIRHYGLSNETAWGTHQFFVEADRIGAPRPVSIQNAYNLLNRTFEINLAETAVRDACGLLAYSPLGAGTLSGKYLDGAVPPGTRRAIDHRRSRYATANADAATRRYLEIARRYELDPCQMALAFVLRQPFVTAAIIGATSMETLALDIDAHQVTLSDALVAEIEAAHRDIPNPCP